jgi:hypothetical protein
LINHQSIEDLCQKFGRQKACWEGGGRGVETCPPSPDPPMQPSSSLQQRDILNANMNAIARQSAVSASRALRVSTQRQQKRGIVDYMTNYPDKVSNKLILKVMLDDCPRRWHGIISGIPFFIENCFQIRNLPFW